jgi:hypothetical protein
MKKIYSHKEIIAATLLGGPVATAWLMSRNFLVFGEKRKAALTWLICIVFTLSLFAVLYFAAEKYYIPRHLIPVSYTIIAHFFIAGFQSKKINDLIHKGTEIFSGWRVALVTVVSAVLTFACVYAITVFYESEQEKQYLSVYYGKLYHTLVYESKNISSAEADSFGSALVQCGYFDEIEQGPERTSRSFLGYRIMINRKEQFRKQILLRKKDNDYELDISTRGFESSGISELNDYFSGVRNDLQKYFPHNRIIVNITTDTENVILLKIEP